MNNFKDILITKFKQEVSSNDLDNAYKHLLELDKKYSDCVNHQKVEDITDLSDLFGSNAMLNLQTGKIEEHKGTSLHYDTHSDYGLAKITPDYLLGCLKECK